MQSLSISQAVRALQSGQVIAYPTEAVYGLGCDPANEQAIQAILDLKQRPAEKGLILIAATVEQLQPWIAFDSPLLNQDILDRVYASWPDAITWILPVKDSVPKLLTGYRDTIAVRVSAHQGVQDLCLAYGSAIVSTSANPSSLPEARDCDTVAHYFPQSVSSNQVLAGCMQGELGQNAEPSQIFNALTGERLR